MDHKGEPYAVYISNPNLNKNSPQAQLFPQAVYALLWGWYSSDVMT